VTYLKYKNIILIPSIFLALIILIPSTALADDTAKIKKELDSSDWQVRLKAVEKLANRSDEEAVNLLLSVVGTRTEYWPVKIEAMLLLGETKDPRAKKLLLSIFHDPNLNWECPSIKTHAVIALGNFKGDPYIVESLIKALDDHEKMTREAGIQSLGKIGDPAAVPHIIESLNEPGFAVKLSAIEALEAIGDPQAIAPLQRIASNDSDDLIRSRAQEAIDNLSEKKSDEVGK
jgi:HEAT repeat protein